jgi:hypothetical protein
MRVACNTFHLFGIPIFFPFLSPLFAVSILDLTSTGFDHTICLPTYLLEGLSMTGRPVSDAGSAYGLVEERRLSIAENSPKI